MKPSPIIFQTMLEDQQASPEALNESEYRDKNRDWLEKSALIALDIHAYLCKNGISKQEFAKMLGVTPAQVTKLLSGKENLGLKTISKIENVLQMDFVAIPNYENMKRVYSVLDLLKFA